MSWGATETYPLPPPQRFPSYIRGSFLHVRFSVPRVLLDLLPTSQGEATSQVSSLDVNEEELGGSICYVCVCGVGVHKRKINQMEAGQGWGTQGRRGTTWETDLLLFTQGQPREAFVKGKWGETTFKGFERQSTGGREIFQTSLKKNLN